MNYRSWNTRQSVLIVEHMSSLQKDPSPFHNPTEPAAWPSQHLLRRWQFRCEMDWNSVKPCTESRLGTSRKRNCKEIWSPPSTQFAKHWHATFCLQITMMRKNFDSNPNAIQEGWSWSTMSPRRAVTKIRDSKVRFLCGSCWKHPTKHCQTIRLSRL